jgi:hypothetical protein
MMKPGAEAESSVAARFMALARAFRRLAAGQWGRIVLVGFVIGALMALSGGFGGGRLPLAARLAYCESLVLIGIGLGRGAVRFIVPRPWFETRRVLAAFLTTLVVGLPMTAVTALAVSWAQHLPLDFALVEDVFPTNLATTAGVVVLALLAQSRAGAETHAAPKGAPPPRFLARLPAKLSGARVWAVQAEDHYLRLRTSLGEDLILMRLADAVAELEGIEGARTHRSWWVARDAVTGVERAEGRAALILPDGARAPVSRSYLKPLREAGWL